MNQVKVLGTYTHHLCKFISDALPYDAVVDAIDVYLRDMWSAEEVASLEWVRAKTK